MSSERDTILTSFRAVVARQGQATALASLRKTISYSALASMAATTTGALADQLERRPYALPIAIPRSPELVAAMLATLSMGSAYLPLDERFPARYTTAVLRHLGAQQVVVGRQTSVAWRSALRSAGAELVEVDSRSTPRAEAPHTSSASLGGDAPAYVLLTSGSTGEPKGVVVPHRAVLRLVVDNDFGACEEDSAWLHHSSPAFDASTLEVWGPLLRGGTCVIHEGPLLGVRELRDALSTFDVSDVWLTATHFNALMEEDPTCLKGCRRVFTGGEVLSQHHVGRAIANCPDVTFVNGYGPTENTTFTTTHRISAEDLDRGAGIPIGKPIRGTTVFLLDDALQPVPPGTAGELCIGGSGLALGYLGNPEATRDRFVEHPLATAPSNRLYRTGDRARDLGNGTYEFLGRMDRQVKLRGLRIELEEVERHLRACAGGAQCVVIVRRDEGGADRLLAFVQSMPSAKLEVAALRASLDGLLPSYAVPERITLVDRLPITASGKLDLEALPGIQVDLSQQAEVPFDLHASTAWEQRVINLMQKILGRSPIGPQDHLLELGGTSLDVVRLAARLHSELGVDVGVAEVLRTPTAQALGLLAQERAGSSATKDRSERPPNLDEAARLSENGLWPLASTQQRIWVMEATSPLSVVPPLLFGLHLSGQIDASRLEGALGTLVDRHPVLRAAYAATADGPRQSFASTYRPRVDVIDAADWSRERVERHAHVEFFRSCQQECSLAKGRVLFARLLALGEASSVLLVWLHHIAGDAWSLSNLLAELDDVLSGRESSAIPSGVHPGLRAIQEQAYWATPEHELARRWWAAQLATAPPMSALRLDQAASGARQAQFGRESLSLDADLVARLEGLGREEGATGLMVLAAGLVALFSHHMGTRDLVVGMPVAARTSTVDQEAMGAYINVVPLRIALEDTETCRSLVRRTRDSIVQAIEHQSVPFEQIVEDVAPSRSGATSPIFQVMLNMGGDITSPPTLGGVPCEMLDLDEVGTSYDMTVYARRRDQRVTIQIVYPIGRFRAERVKELLDQYLLVLADVALDPEQDIKRLPRRTARATRLLPREDRLPAIAEVPTVAIMFETCAARAPDAVAVRDGEASWSYGDLQAASTWLGLRLCHEVRREGTAAILGPPGFAFVAAMLGALRTRRPFLLLDPELPLERLEAMMEMANAAVILHSGCAKLPAQLAAWAERACVEVLPIGEEAASSPSTSPRGQAVEASSIEARLDEAAYAVFTSGSTGAPKGIWGSHRALSHFLTWQRSELGVGPSDRFAQLTAISFDVALRDILTPLISGAELLLPPAGLRSAVSEVHGWIVGSQITVLHAVPTLATEWIREAAPVEAGALRAVCFAGEPLSADLVDTWRAVHGHGCRVYNFYGPSETTLAKCFYSVPLPAPRGAQPVGHPLPAVDVFVVDPEGQSCALDVAGEVVIRPPFRPLGYVSTSDAQGGFCPLAWSSSPGASTYRTGDRGVWRSDGLLQLLGRVDDQVKVRGVRVEPAGVAAILREHVTVEDAYVLGRQSPDGAWRLDAYVVPTAEGGVRPRDLRKHLLDQVVPAAVPDAFVVLPALPRLPNGKVDREQLAHLAPEAAGLELSSRPPQSRLERNLIRVWEELLPFVRIGVDDDFFDLGGNSLMAVRMLERVARQAGQAISLQAFLRTPTIEGIAASLESVDEGDAPEDSDAVVSFHAAGTSQPIFCLPGLGGTAAFTFMALAEAMGQDWPLHALQVPWPSREGASAITVEGIASQLLPRILQVQAQGPYALVGYSFGGRLALELARMLVARGEHVCLLAMVDSSAPGYPRILPWHRRLVLHARQTWRAGPIGAARYVAGRVARRWSRIVQRRRRTRAARRNQQIGKGSGDGEGLATILRQASTLYRPDPYEGSMLLFRSHQREHWLGASFDDPYNGWSEFVRGVISTRLLTGGHTDAMRPHNASRIAEAIRQHLRP